MKSFTLEICANSIESALAAQKGGADRIELCDNMEEGGTTPSWGMIKLCRELLSIPVFPIIRPRGGNFIYTDSEFEVMKADITMCRELGCEGVVFGMLNTEAGVDQDRTAALLALARPMEVTFHRAFDCCANLEKSLEEIIALGCNRILTSGGKPSAPDGREVIRQLVQTAAGRISIMPGSGITETNLADIAVYTGAAEFHSTAKEVILTKNVSENAAVSRVSGNILQTSANKVHLMKNILIEQQR